MTADLIEGYLDQLLTHLRGSATDVRRILSETEEHLRDATAELEAAGASREEAQRLAVERFLALLSLDAFLVADGDGTGQWLSAAIVAAAMAAIYGVSLYRTVLTQARFGAAELPPDLAEHSST